MGRAHFRCVARRVVHVSTYSVKLLLLLAVSLALDGCADLPSEPSDIQEQQAQRSFYSPGNPTVNNPPPDSTPPREPVPGEVVPNR